MTSLKQHRAFCQHVGLQRMGTSNTYKGTLDGFQVRSRWQRGRNAQRPAIITTVELPTPMPKGVKIASPRLLDTMFESASQRERLLLNHPLDDEIQVRVWDARRGPIQQLLGTPGLYDAVADIVFKDAGLDIYDNKVEVHHWSPDVEPVLYAQLHLAAALVAAQYDFWGTLDGFLLCDDQRSGSGTIAGTPIRLTTQKHHHRIDAELARPFPAGTRITRGSGGAALRDPILNGRITVRSSDVGAVEARISLEAMRGLVLELLLGPFTQAVIGETCMHVQAVGAPSFVTPLQIHRLAELAWQV